jgi:hypothetical protein
MRNSWSVTVNGPLITNDIGLLTRAAINAVGLTFRRVSTASLGLRQRYPSIADHPVSIS